MTTYHVTSNETGHHLIASWPDFPEPVTGEVATFEEAKLAGAARRVLDAASRFRWHRALQLWRSEIASEDQAPSWLPQLPAGVVLGESPMNDDLMAATKKGEGDEDERYPLRLGNLGPLLWTDWRDHLTSKERHRLSAELEADLEAVAGDYVTGRARQFAWYLSADLLLEMHRTPDDAKDEGGEDKAGPSGPSVPERCGRLLGDLTGLEVEQFAADNELLVHTPVTTVEFEKAQGGNEGWVYWSPDQPEAFPFHENWRHEGDLPAGLTVGALAGFIVERVADGNWPFGGQQPPDEKPRGIRGLWQRGH